MLVIGVAGHELQAHERDWLQHEACAGVILFARNFASRAQVAALSQAIREAAPRPQLVCVDQEGGRVQRFRDGYSALPALQGFDALYRDDPAAALALAGWVAAGWLDGGRSYDAQRLRIAEVRRGDLVRDLSADGRLIAANSPTLYAIAAGTVSLKVVAGDAVKRGQALAVIDAIAATGVALEAVAPEHWRHVQARMTAGLAPQPYTAARHRALRLRFCRGARP